MANRYIVSCRANTDDLTAQFGEDGSEHTLTDTEVVAAILRHGRATITHCGTWPERHDHIHTSDGTATYTIEFENAYD